MNRRFIEAAAKAEPVSLHIPNDRVFHRIPAPGRLANCNGTDSLAWTFPPLEAYVRTSKSKPKPAKNRAIPMDERI